MLQKWAAEKFIVVTILRRFFRLNINCHYGSFRQFYQRLWYMPTKIQPAGLDLTKKQVWKVYQLYQRRNMGEIQLLLHLIQFKTWQHWSLALFLEWQKDANCRMSYSKCNKTIIAKTAQTVIVTTCFVKTAWKFNMIFVTNFFIFF